MEKAIMDPLDLECDVPSQESEILFIQSENKYEIQLSADGDPALDCITMTLVVEGETVNVPLCEDEYFYTTVGKNGAEIWKNIETNSTRIKQILESLEEEPTQEGHELVEIQAGCLPHDESPSDSMASAMILGALVLSRVRSLMKK